MSQWTSTPHEILEWLDARCRRQSGRFKLPLNCCQKLTERTCEGGQLLLPRLNLLNAGNDDLEYGEGCRKAGDWRESRGKDGGVEGHGGIEDKRASRNPTTVRWLLRRLKLVDSRAPIGAQQAPECMAIISTYSVHTEYTVLLKSIRQGV
jgi:hypothetical protein